MELRLPANAPAPHGAQLRDEILAAVGVDINRRYGYSPPSIIRMADDADLIENEAAIQAVIDAHVPAFKRTVLTKREFRARFTSAELKLIRESNDDNVQDLREEFLAANNANLEDTDLINGVTLLETDYKQNDGVTPILAAGRAAQILDPTV